MSKQTIILALLSALAGLLLASSSIRIRYSAPSGASVLIELEKQDNLHQQVQRHESDEASAGAFISISGWDTSHPNYGRDVAGETAFLTNISAPGTYHVWVRAHWKDTCSNSVTFMARPTDLGQSSTKRYLIGNDATLHAWHWVRGPSIQLKSGEHELLLGTRETLAKVDCVLLTQSVDRPSRTVGHDAHRPGRDDPPTQRGDFYRDDLVMDDPSDPTSSGWSYSESSWRSVRAARVTAIGPTAAKVTRATAPVPECSNAIIRCSLLMSDRAGSGVFFGATGNDDYFVVRLASRHSARPYAGKIQLAYQNGGKTEELAIADINLSELNWWNLLQVQINGTYCEVNLQGETLIEARLPSAPFGKLGAYVDGVDEMLGKRESLIEVLPSANQRISMSDILQLSSTSSINCRALLLGYRPTESYIARWTNFDPAGRRAKRLELSVINESGQARFLDERWGLFSADQISQLTLSWSDGTVNASVGDETICHAKGTLDSNLVGFVRTNQPRAFFGDFSVELFDALSTSDQNLWRPEDESNSPATFTGIESVSEQQTWSMSLQQGDPFEFAIVNLQLEQRHLPFGVGFYDSSRDNYEILWLSRLDNGPLVAEFAVGESRPLGVSKIELPEIDIPECLQVLVEPSGLKLLVRDKVVLSAPATKATQRRLAYWSLDASSHQTRIAEIVSYQPNYFTFKQESAEPIAAHQRVQHGDASVYAEVADPRQLKLSIHEGNPGSPPRGYQLVVEKSDPPQWSVLRNGQLIATDKVPAKDSARSGYELSQIGRWVFFERDHQIQWQMWDTQPIRQGFASALAVLDKKTPASYAIKHTWDVMSIFHPEGVVDAESAASYWTSQSGQWHLVEAADGSGFLSGWHVDGRASLQYARQVKQHEILLELTLAETFVRSENRFVISLTHDDNSNDFTELVAFGADKNRLLTVGMQQNSQRIRESYQLDDSKRDLTFTVLRTPDAIQFYVDSVLVAAMERNFNRPVTGITLSLVGATSQPVYIRSILLQHDPISPDRVPIRLRQRLQFLKRAFLATRVE